ncbi:hypothetical protein FRUB_06295 [Fimbriiglobus ruber]|uniref:Uncharacterized protein n=1 Tax=Fimbriiglobus ruber TaxID=1908690 RepID=A0A225DDZ2_9BACT|nr:hypothetical protein FRUB_06295 [Fimbriiglobus ruber]
MKYPDMLNRGSRTPSVSLRAHCQNARVRGAVAQRTGRLDSASTFLNRPVAAAL